MKTMNWVTPKTNDTSLIGKTVDDEKHGRGIIVDFENGVAWVRLDGPGCKMLVIHVSALELNDEPHE